MTITSEALAVAGVLFGLRLLNNAISTVRLLMLAQQRRTITFILGFFEALVFAVSIAGVVTDLTNILNLLAYSGGFAVGGYIGMMIEARFVTGYLRVNLYASEFGHELAEALRGAGYGVTETAGVGRDGEVIALNSVVNKRQLPHLIDVAQTVNPKVFIAVEEVRAVYRGYLGERRVTTIS
jgi:uncharacterized protein YebE (UPF0316 family)